MIVVCDFDTCKFNESGFCAREILAIKVGGAPQAQVPTCDLFVSQNAGSKGCFYPNEFSRRKRKADIVIEDVEYKEDKDEQLDDKSEEVSTSGSEGESGEQDTGSDSGVSEERSSEEL